MATNNLGRGAEASGGYGYAATSYCSSFFAPCKTKTSVSVDGTTILPGSPTIAMIPFPGKQIKRVLMSVTDLTPREWASTLRERITQLANNMGWCTVLQERLRAWADEMPRIAVNLSEHSIRALMNEKRHTEHRTSSLDLAEDTERLKAWMSDRYNISLERYVAAMVAAIDHYSANKVGPDGTFGPKNITPFVNTDFDYIMAVDSNKLPTHAAVALAHTVANDYDHDIYVGNLLAACDLGIDLQCDTPSGQGVEDRHHGQFKNYTLACSFVNQVTRVVRNNGRMPHFVVLGIGNGGASWIPNDPNVAWYTVDERPPGPPHAQAGWINSFLTMATVDAVFNRIHAPHFRGPSELIVYADAYVLDPVECLDYHRALFTLRRRFSAAGWNVTMLVKNGNWSIWRPVVAYIGDHYNGNISAIVPHFCAPHSSELYVRVPSENEVAQLMGGNAPPPLNAMPETEVAFNVAVFRITGAAAIPQPIFLASAVRDDFHQDTRLMNLFQMYIHLPRDSAVRIARNSRFLREGVRYPQTALQNVGLVIGGPVIIYNPVPMPDAWGIHVPVKDKSVVGANTDYMAFDHSHNLEDREAVLDVVCQGLLADAPRARDVCKHKETMRELMDQLQARGLMPIYNKVVSALNTDEQVMARLALEIRHITHLRPVHRDLKQPLDMEGKVNSGEEGTSVCNTIASYTEVMYAFLHYLFAAGAVVPPARALGRVVYNNVVLNNEPPVKPRGGYVDVDETSFKMQVETAVLQVVADLPAGTPCTLYTDRPGPLADHANREGHTVLCPVAIPGMNARRGVLETAALPANQVVYTGLGTDLPFGATYQARCSTVIHAAVLSPEGSCTFPSGSSAARSDVAHSKDSVTAVAMHRKLVTLMPHVRWVNTDSGIRPEWPRSIQQARTVILVDQRAAAAAARLPTAYDKKWEDEHRPPP